MSENLINTIFDEKILPIIRERDASKAIDIAKALHDGGIKVMEVTVENSSIYYAIEKISEFASVCAGGVITSVQANASILSGAKILSSPIFSINLVRLSKDKHIPYIAGTSSANEAYEAWKARMPLIKIYPITAMGGTMYLEDMLRPMPFLNMMPLGNIKLSEVKSYINVGAKAVGVGRDLYYNLSYKEITERAKKTVNDLRS